MKTSSFGAAFLAVSSLCGCDHPAAPAAPEAPPLTEAPAALAAPAASDSASTPSPAPPRGKRSPCTTDQSCNRDPSVSALWGRCLKDSGVCECNAGFELHPGGYCQPIVK
ncbi:MAG TPA: hypothetical protein VGC79_36340 [Polyangiaceae bacterium]